MSPPSAGAGHTNVSRPRVFYLHVFVRIRKHPLRIERITMALDTSNWTREDLIKEAGMQTTAIQRIKVWLRLGYSAVAIGFLLGYWGFYGSGPVWAGVAGIVLLVLGVLVSVPLKIGVTNAQKNVEKILQAAEKKGDAKA